MLRIALITLGDPQRLSGGYLYHRRMRELAPRFGAQIDFVSFPDRPFPLPALAGASVLRDVRRVGATVLVLDSIAAAYLAPWTRSLHRAPPLVAMLHQPPGGIDSGKLRTTIQMRLDGLAYRRALHILVASDSLADQLAEQGVPRERMTVVPPGRDVAEAADAPPLDVRHGHHAAFLCVGNWIERKGIHDLLDAFARLPAAAGTLHLVGDDQADARYSARLRARLRQPDLAGRVIVHGPVSRERVAALYRAADVFVLPSTREPYGTVYGEAMASGLPVVGWRAGNLPYLATDGLEGILIAPGDLDG
jgi:glycosyltransferase involved in cell wall biosynthesis